MTKEPQHTAYLVVTLTTNGSPFPTVCNLDIYSSDASNLTTALNGELYADILSATGSTYHEAHKKLLEHIQYLIDFLPKSYRWMVPWLDESEGAHQARWYWQRHLGGNKSLIAPPARPKPLEDSGKL